MHWPQDEGGLEEAERQAEGAEARRILETEQEEGETGARQDENNMGQGAEANLIPPGKIHVLVFSVKILFNSWCSVEGSDPLVIFHNLLHISFCT